MIYSGYDTAKHSHNGHGNGHNFRGRRNNVRGTQVDIDAIFNGRDTHCTVVLRNIPNKVTMPELKKILDRTFFSLYGFSSLQIEFANQLALYQAEIPCATTIEDPAKYLILLRVAVVAASNDGRGNQPRHLPHARY